MVSARQIIAADISDEKLAHARTFGATALVSSARDDLAERVTQLTDGRGVEVAIEAIGLPKTIESAYAALARGGTAVVAGEVADRLKISTPAADFPSSSSTTSTTASTSTRW